jgi:hypothetical protein
MGGNVPSDPSFRVCYANDKGQQTQNLTRHKVLILCPKCAKIHQRSSVVSNIFSGVIEESGNEMGDKMG